MHKCTWRCLEFKVVHGKIIYYCGRGLDKEIPMKHEGAKLTLVRILSQLTKKGYINIEDGRITLTQRARRELEKEESNQQLISFDQ